MAEAGPGAAQQPEVCLCELLKWSIYQTLLGLQSVTAKISVFSLMVTNTSLLTLLKR